MSNQNSEQNMSTSSMDVGTNTTASCATIHSRQRIKISNENLNQLEPSFMYTQIFKVILNMMKNSSKIYRDNIRELSIIDDIENRSELIIS
jgi:hypothetical protein